MSEHKGISQEKTIKKCTAVPIDGAMEIIGEDMKTGYFSPKKEVFVK